MDSEAPRRGRRLSRTGQATLLDVGGTKRRLAGLNPVRLNDFFPGFGETRGQQPADRPRLSPLTKQPPNGFRGTPSGAEAFPNGPSNSTGCWWHKTKTGRTKPCPA